MNLADMQVEYNETSSPENLPTTLHSIDKDSAFYKFREKISSLRAQKIESLVEAKEKRQKQERMGNQTRYLAKVTENLTPYLSPQGSAKPTCTMNTLASDVFVINTQPNSKRRKTHRMTNPNPNG